MTTLVSVTRGAAKGKIGGSMCLLLAMYRRLTHAGGDTALIKAIFA